jgi:hypothetical protein
MEKVPPARNDGRTELVSRRWLLRLAGSAGVAAIVSGCRKFVTKAATGPSPIPTVTATEPGLTATLPLTVTVGLTPSISTLTDSFATKDTTKWTWAGAAAATSGQLVLPVATAGTNSITTPIPYNLVGAQIVAQLVGPPNPGNGGQRTWLRLSNQTGTNQVAMMVSGDGAANGYLRFGCRDTVNSVNSDTYVPYASVAALEYWDNFMFDANTNLPATAPSGQSYTRTWNPNVSATPIISNGQQVQNYYGASKSGSYLTAGPLAGATTFMAGDFTFTSGGATDGGCGLLLCIQQDLPQDIRGWAGMSGGSPCHLSACPDRWIYYVIDGSGIHLISSVQYLSRMATQHVEVTIDTANSQVYIRGADGVTTTVSHPDVGALPAYYPVAEVFCNNSNTDNRVGYTRYAATSTPLVGRFALANASAWVRIREAGGTVYWEASTDGTHWMTLRSGAPGWDVSQCYVTLSSDYSGTETSLSSATWDNINS